jgi:hypothetical protein
VPTGKPIEDRWGSAAWNLLHIPAFALVTFCILRFFGDDRNSFQCRFYSASLAIAMGIASEAIQARVGRSASFQDVILDFLGVLLAVSWPHRPETWTVLRRSLCGGVILAGIALAFASGLRQELAEQRMRSRLPEIGNFKSMDGRCLWQTQGGATSRVDNGSGALELRLVAGDFGGINFLPGNQDWSGYSELVMKFFNPGPRLDLGLRIDDDISANDRIWFSDRVELTEGLSEVRVDLRRRRPEVSDQERVIDFSRTRRLVLFIERTEDPVEFSIISAVLN